MSKQDSASYIAIWLSKPSVSIFTDLVEGATNLNHTLFCNPPSPHHFIGSVQAVFPNVSGIGSFGSTVAISLEYGPDFTPNGISIASQTLSFSGA